MNTTLAPTHRTRLRGLRRLAFALAPAALLQAQEPLALTLGGAARLAAERNAAPMAAKERVSQADARVRQRRADFLPNFSIAASDVERTFNSASMGISFRDANTGRFLFDPNGQILGPVRAWDLRGSLTQKIYDSGAFARLRAAQASVGAATADVSVASQQAEAAPDATAPAAAPSGLVIGLSVGGLAVIVVGVVVVLLVRPRRKDDADDE